MLHDARDQTETVSSWDPPMMRYNTQYTIYRAQEKQIGGERRDIVKISPISSESDFKYNFSDLIQSSLDLTLNPLQ